jgi:hypothetical protein
VKQNWLKTFSCRFGVLKTRGMEACPKFIYYFFLYLDFAVCIFGIIGNSTVIYVIYRERVLKSKLNLLVMSVAASDLIIGIFVIPLGLMAVRQKNEG